MNWQKIIFDIDESPSGKPLEISMTAMQRAMLAGKPKQFAVFLGHDAELRSILYFSPVAVNLCSDLLASYSAIICDAPKPGQDSIGLGVGDPATWELVK